LTNSPLAPIEIADLLERVRAVVAARVIGQDAVIEQALVAFLTGGHALLEGVPGTAKTILVRALAGALGLRFGRIQFTPDLMPADVTGISIRRDASRGFEFHPGPIFTDFLLADEINRAPAKTQAALLEGMAERQVTVDGQTRPLGDRFTTFATQNPVEYEGTYPLPEAQLDRFLVKIAVRYPSLDASDVVPDAVLDAETCAMLRSAVDQVTVAPEIRAYIASIVRATREDPSLLLGGSPRATVSLFRVSRGAALMDGRDFVTPDDVKNYAAPVLRHRLRLSPELEVEGRTADDVLRDLTSRIAAPQ
jgi:MoxR-like ATPase